MIKRIELVNFMSHSHTVIEPAAGLTVLVGPNNCGKSAVVSALQILCNNDNSTYVLRHKEKNCQVIVETDEGHVVEWSRKKNGSPKYTIDGKSFDRLKRSVPPELHSALRLPKVNSDKTEFDVHFGEQKRPVFLLNDSGAAAAEFFASSSDAIRLVEMQALHKQRARDARRDQSNLEKEKQLVESSIQKLIPVKKLDKSIVEAEKQYVQLCAQAEHIQLLEKTIKQTVDCNKNLIFCESLVGCLEKLPTPPPYCETTELDSLIWQLAITNINAEQFDAQSKALEKLAPPPEIADESPLEAVLVQMQAAKRRLQLDESKLKLFGKLKAAPELKSTDELNELITSVANRRNILIELDKRLDKIVDELSNVQQDIQTWAKANPICPTCKSPIDAKKLVTLSKPKGSRK